MRVASAFLETAYSGVSSSQPAPVHTHQPQTWTDAGYAFRRSLPAADLMQDWSALCRAGFTQSGFSLCLTSTSSLLTWPGLRSRLFSHCIRATGSRRSRAHILPVEQVLQRIAHLAFKHRIRLSSSPSLDGFKTIEKAFDEWAKRRFGIGQK